MFNIVLVHPQIPQNTGSIGRMCVNADCKLHIIKPTMFEISDKTVKRAGLDYWPLLDLSVWENLDAFLEAHNDQWERFYFATTKSTGLPMDLMLKKWENAITIPMGKHGRSLNQATSAGIILYDAIRQNFEVFKQTSLS